MGQKKKNPEPDLHELLSIAVDETLPEDAEARCLERVARETGPVRLLIQVPQPPEDVAQIPYPNATDDIRPDRDEP